MGLSLKWWGPCQALAEKSVSSAKVSQCPARKCSWPLFQALFFTHQVNRRNMICPMSDLQQTTGPLVTQFNVLTSKFALSSSVDEFIHFTNIHRTPTMHQNHSRHWGCPSGQFNRQWVPSLQCFCLKGTQTGRPKELTSEQWPKWWEGFSHLKTLGKNSQAEETACFRTSRAIVGQGPRHGRYTGRSKPSWGAGVSSECLTRPGRALSRERMALALLTLNTVQHWDWN